MHFTSRHVFENVDLPTFEQLYFEEEFNVALCRAVQIERELVSHAIDDGRVHREVIVYPKRKVPRPIQAFLGSERVGYREVIDYALGSGRASFVCIPTLMAERVRTTGEVLLRIQGSGVERVVEGEVAVKVFGLGSTIERFIVADVERSFADAAAFTADYLRRQPR